MPKLTAAQAASVARVRIGPWPLDEFLDHFNAVDDGDGWLGHCPAHKDENASLRLTAGETRFLINCRSGCNPYEVIDAAGLNWSNLPDPSQIPASRHGASTETPATAEELQALRDQVASFNPPGPEVLAYVERRFRIDAELAGRFGLAQKYGDDGGLRLVVPFRDVDGQVQNYQSRAIDPEADKRWLSVERPSSGGAWGKVGLLTHSGGVGPVLITEGPGDGLTAAAMGYDVAFLPGSGLAANRLVQKALREFCTSRGVVLVGDGDNAGRRFNSTLAAALNDARVLAVPEGEDLSSWCAEVGAAAVREAVAQAPESDWDDPWRPTSIFDWVETPVELLPGGIFPAGKTIQLFGEPSSGKSTLMVWQAVQCIRAGLKVVWVDEEADLADVAKRFRRQGATPADAHLMDYYRPAGRDVRRNADKIVALCVGAALVVLDSLPDFLANAGLDENHGGDTTTLYTVIQRIRRLGATVVGIDHVAKHDKKGKDGRGSGAKRGKADTSYRVDAVEPFSKRLSGYSTIVNVKDRTGEVTATVWQLNVEANMTTVSVTESDHSVVEAQRERIKSTAPAVRRKVIAEVLMDDPNQSSEGLRKTVGLILKERNISPRGATVIDQDVRDMVAVGLVTKSATKHGHSYALAEEVS